MTQAANLAALGTNAGTTGILPAAGGGTGTSAGVTGFKNRIINGNMVIDQRNAGASVGTGTLYTVYTADRWQASYSAISKYTIQQNAGSVTPPAGFTNYLGCTSSSSYSVGSTDYFGIQQIVEGFNVADLAWGTANAQPITISFWVRSSGLTYPATFGGVLQNSGGNYNYPFSYTISAANTWEKVSITIAGATSGSWNTTNGAGIYVFFSLGTGTTYSATAGTWTTSLEFSATGATSVVGTNGATFYITGVQLEVGSTATSFDYRPYGTELALCKRYYHYVGGTANGFPLVQLYAGSGNQPVVPICFPSQMRATPTMTVVGTWGATNSTGNPSFIYISPDGASMILTAVSTGMVEAWANTTDDRANFSAEL